MVRDTVGNSLRRAKEIGLGSAVGERIGKSDKSDFYRFSLTSSNRLNIRLRSSGANADVEIIQDRNGNGRVDRGEILKRSLKPTKLDRVSLPTISAGTFFLRVFTRNHSKESFYRLAVSAQPISTGGTPSANPNSGARNPPGSSSGNGFAEAVVRLTNAFRQQFGLQPLSMNAKLNSAAQAYSQAMATQDFFSHTGLDGSQPWDRITAAGYRWARAAENIAAGQRTPEEVVNSWINSPGHRANILNPDLKEIGVGYYELVNDTGSINYNRYWTQDFGTSR